MVVKVGVSFFQCPERLSAALQIPPPNQLTRMDLNVDPNETGAVLIELPLWSSMSI